MNIKFLRDYEYRPVPAVVTPFKKDAVADLPDAVAETLIADGIAVQHSKSAKKEK